ncbi:MAG: hypothetical protein AB8G99_06925 [Planctomycetaceae bacterium]
MASLTDRSVDDLKSIVQHTDAVFDELRGMLDDDPATTEALRVLIQSETTTEDFVVLLTSQPDVGRKLLESALSSLVNVHSRATVDSELSRRSE